MGRIQSSEPEGGAEGYVLLEVLLLVALLGGVLGGIGLWQASIRLMEERRAESAAVFLVEGGLNQMETRLTLAFSLAARTRYTLHALASYKQQIENKLNIKTIDTRSR